MSITIPKLENHAANVLLQAAWMHAEREDHDTASLLAVVLPSLDQRERDGQFERICASLDSAEHAANVNDDHTLADTYLDDAQQVIRYLLTRQSDAAEDQAIANVTGPHLAVVTA